MTDSIRYVGVNDHDVDLFEGQYVVPNGMAYNSYVILDEKVAILDTVDHHKCAEFLDNLDAALAGRKPDYLIIHHIEPDHASSVQAVVERWPEVKLVGGPKTFPLLAQYFPGLDFSSALTVKEGDQLSLGSHVLHFVSAPMVHWPEVMMSYESTEKVLFSADAFGKFGALDAQEDWDCEARRYYFNIVGKYGTQVQTVLKKAAGLDIATICPLHGPILKEDLGHYIGKYLTWASYEPEDEGVTIVYGSIHGHTAKAAKLMQKMLEDRGQKVEIFDLARDDMAEAIECAYRYDKLVIATVTYDAGVFPVVEDFVYHLKLKNYQKRTVGIIQNGSWGPVAGKKVKESLETLKDIKIVDPMVTIRSALKEGNLTAMEALADALVAK